MTVEVTGLEAVLLKLAGLDKPENFRRPMNQAVQHIHRRIMKYPSRSKRPQPFKTDKSRRYFFWALKAGKIEVPYRRGQSPGSEQLQQSWTTSVSVDGRQGKVGNDTTYGPLVQDRSQQTAYHAGTGWTTSQDVVESEQDEVVGFFEAQYRRYTAE